MTDNGTDLDKGITTQPLGVPAAWPAFAVQLARSPTES
jgi:hypothetical protein